MRNEPGLSPDDAASLRRLLDEERSRNAGVLDRIPDCVVVADASGRIVFGNARCAELLGIGATFHAAIARALVGEKVSGDPVDLHTDGKVRHLDVSAAPIRDEAGAIIAAVAVVEEVTDLRRMQRERAALKDATQLCAEGCPLPELLPAMARVVSNRLHAACAIDLLEGGSLRRVETAPQEDWLTSLVRVAPKLDLLPALQAILDAGRPAIVPEYVSLYGDTTLAGEVTSLLGSQALVIVPLKVGNQVIGALELYRKSPETFTANDLDLAELLAEVAASALDRARLSQITTSSFRACDELVSALTLEIRRSLGAVMLTAAALTRNQGTSGDRVLKAQRRGALLQRTAERISGVLSDALDLTGLESGRLSLVKRPTDPAPLVREAAEALEASIAERRIAVEHPELLDLPLVMVDPDRLFQVLWSLGQSAAKLTAEDGALRFAAQHVGRAVHFSITQEGGDVPPHEVTLLGEHPLETRQLGSRGAAIGVALAKKLIEAHGGRLWAAPWAGAGVRFVFTLPLAA